jgi:hypothetical protein
MSNELTTTNDQQAQYGRIEQVQLFDLAQREAIAWSKAGIVPKAYQNKISDCIVALDVAKRMGASPLQVMQNLYIVHGTPSWSSTFLIAAVNHCGRYGSLRYEERGDINSDDYGVRAYAYEKGSSDKLCGSWITWKMVKAEGWLDKAGSKWKTMPEQMFRYRAAAFWQRTYAPEIGMGFSTAEEVEDIGYAEVLNERPVRLSIPMMNQAKAELESDTATLDDILSKFPNLPQDQVDELRGMSKPITLNTSAA